MRKKVILGAFAFVLVIAGAVIFTYKPLKTITVQQASPLPVSLATAVPYGSDSIVLSNDRSFVSYSFTAKRSALLSPDTPFSGLKDIDTLSVSADQNYLLFHASIPPQGGPLLDYLTSNDRDTSTDHWWVYNIKAKSFIALSDDVLRAKFDGDSIRALSYSNGQESIQTLSADPHQTPVSIQVTGVSDFWAVAGGLLLSDSENKLSFTTDGSVSTKMFDANTEVVGTNKQGQLFILQDNDDARSLAMYDFGTKKLQVIDRNVVGQPALNSAANLILYSVQPDIAKPVELRLYSGATKATARISVANPPKGISLNTPVAAIDDTTFVVLDKQNQPYLLADTAARIATPDSGYNRQVVVNGVAIQIMYDETDNRILAHVAYNDLSSGVAAVDDQLRADHYDPQMLAVEFVGDDYDSASTD